MTETFYVRVNITSDEDLEFYSENSRGDEVQYKADPKTRKKFNSQVEKAIKKVFMKNMDMISNTLDNDEGLDYEKQEALDEVASKFYDSDVDLTAITECMTPDIKLKVVGAPK
mgnify:CR=1 FL=1